MPPSSFAAHLARASALLFPLAWAGVVGGELGGGEGGPMIWDKALHFGAYFILATLISMALARRWRLWALLGLILMGGLLEIVQGLIGRDCSFYDEVANTLGVVAGAIVGWSVMSLVRLRHAD